MVVPTRNTLTAHLEQRKEVLIAKMANTLAAAVLTLGQGAFCLQLDAVKTKKGSCEPVLLSWIDGTTMERQVTVIGIGYETGKAARHSAQNVRNIIKGIGLVKVLEQILASKGDLDPSSPFKALAHFEATYLIFKDKYMTEAGMNADDAKAAAVASYMIGAATTDGACLGLLEALVSTEKPQQASGQPAKRKKVMVTASGTTAAANSGADERDDSEADEDDGDKALPALNVTNWCAAHQLSLAGRFSFGEKEQSEIWPPDRKSRIIMADFLRRLKELCDFYSDIKMFKALEAYAERKGVPVPKTMNTLCPTRFNSLGYLLGAVQHNKAAFLMMHELSAEARPQVVSAVILAQTITVDGSSYTYTPIQHIDPLMHIADALIELTLYAEANNGDACLFQNKLSLFVRQLHGQAPWRRADKDKTVITLPSSDLVTSVIANLKVAIGFYFDKSLHLNWAMLICMALHPFSLPSVNKDNDGDWAFLKGRFKDIWTKSAKKNARGAAFDCSDEIEALHNVMKAASLLLAQELNLQYDIDHGAEQSPTYPAGTSATSATDADDDLFPTLKASVSSSSDELKKNAVAVEMQAWSNTRLQDTKAAKEPLLTYWAGQPDSMLKRVAIRAAAFLVSQCATERFNKIPKQIWQDGRMSLLDNSALRDALLHFHGGVEEDAEFEWPEIKAGVSAESV